MARRRRHRQRAAIRAASLTACSGPAPAPLSRLKGEHRAQFFLKGTQRAAMREALLAALDGAAGDRAADDRRRGSDDGAVRRAIASSQSAMPSRAAETRL